MIEIKQKKSQTMSAALRVFPNQTQKLEYSLNLLYKSFRRRRDGIGLMNVEQKQHPLLVNV